MYDAEIGSPGLIIDGTAFVGGEGESLPLSESYEDMVAGVTERLNAIGTLIDAQRVSEGGVWISKMGSTILSEFIYISYNQAHIKSVTYYREALVAQPPHTLDPHHEILAAVTPHQTMKTIGIHGHTSIQSN